MPYDLRQRPAAELPASTWDVAIVGAGPAGSTAAMSLARHGYRVLLLDRDRFPREKVCGDGLIADTLECLGRFGLRERIEAAGHPVQRAALFSPSRHRVDVPGEFVTLKRETFDAILAEAAVAAGATFAQGSVTGLDILPDGSVECRVQDTPLRARVGILATGAGIKLGRQLGLITRRSPSAVAMRQYIRSTSGPLEMVISYDRSILPGYAWIFPLGGGDYNVGCGTFHQPQNGTKTVDLRGMLDRFVHDFPVARELIAGAESRSPLKGAPLRCDMSGAAPVGDGNLLMVGESIGSTYPLTGEGIGKSMETGELAADVIHQALRINNLDRLRQFEPRLDAELRPCFRGYQTAERWLTSPRFADFFAHRAQRSRFLQDFIGQVFNDSADPRQAFSITGLMRSFFI